MTKIVTEVSRRKLLLRAAQGFGLLALSGCEKVFDSLSQNSTVQTILESAEQGNRRVQRLLARRGKLAQEFAEKDISPKFRSNGNPPPITMDYAADARNQWTNWRLEVGGLVQQPSRFSLVELQAMPARTQIPGTIASKAGARSANGRACHWHVFSIAYSQLRQRNILSFIAWTATIAARSITKAST